MPGTEIEGTVLRGREFGTVEGRVVERGEAPTDSDDLAGACSAVRAVVRLAGVDDMDRVVP